MSPITFQEPVTGKNVIAGTHVSGGSSVTYHFAAPPESAQGCQHAQEEALQREKEACLQSLIFPNMKARCDNIANAHTGTCGWLFSTAEFEMWQHGVDFPTHNGVLWIKGKPGVGKSTLMKHTLHHCESIFHDHMIVTYFFNARGDILEKTPQGLWQSIVYQLLDKDATLWEEFIPKFRDMRRTFKNMDIQWQQSQLNGFVASVIKKRKREPLLILIDALDECDEQNVRSVVECLESLSVSAAETGTTLRICLSSRHYPSISMNRMLELTVEGNKYHHEDISLYIEDRLKINDEVIKAKLLHKANGIFMWVVLVISLLHKSYDEGQMEDAHRTLEEVPESLEEVFTSLLKKDAQMKAEMIRMLQWVLLSERPLSPEELFTIAVQEDLPTADLIERRITSSSNGLIEIRKGDKISVQFIHLSVNDFLFRNKRLQTLDQTLEPDPITASHGQLWQSCWLYMKHVGIERVEDEQRSRLSIKYPFLAYSATHMLYHADKALSDQTWNKRFNWLKVFSKFQSPSNFQELTEKFIRKHTEWFQTWKLLIEALPHAVPDSTNYDKHGQVLYVLSLRGYENLLRSLLCESRIGINVQGGRHGNALQAACYNENEAIVQLLIEKGADINAKGCYYGTALQTACYVGNKAIFDLLIKQGVDINAQGDHYGTALQTACHKENEAIVRLLIEKGADINAQGGHYGTALQAACYIENEAIVRLLIEKDANINAQGGYHGTALQTACHKENEAIIRLLIEKGADINAQGGIYGNALRAACYNRNESIVTLLIQKGADINAQGSHYGTALQVAFYERNGPIVRLLIKKGADINMRVGLHGNALQASFYDKYEDMFNILVEEGVDIMALTM